MDDIAVNDPKMNSMFSIDLIKSGDIYQQHVVGFRKAIQNG
jgi:hypothetical protein